MRVFFLLTVCTSFLHAAELCRTDCLPYRVIQCNDRVSALSYSKNGQILFVGTAGKGETSSLELYNCRAEKYEISFSHPTPIEVVDSNPDNKSIACASDDVCKIWELERACVKQELKDNPNNFITSLEYDSEGNRLLIGYKNGMCKIWDVRTKAFHRLEAQNGEVYCARWSPDNSNLATLGADRTIKLWNCKDYGLVKSEKRLTASPVTLAFNPATDDLICAGLNIYVYEPVFAFSQVFNLNGKQESTGGSKLFEDPTKPKACSVAFIPGNKDYVVAGINNGSVCLCNRRDTKESVVLNAFLAEKSLHEQAGKALAVNPDGKTLAVGSYFDGMVRLWKIEELLPYLKRTKEWGNAQSVFAIKSQKECCSIH